MDMDFIWDQRGEESKWRGIKSARGGEEEMKRWDRTGYFLENRGEAEKN